MGRTNPDDAVAEDALPLWCGGRHQIPSDFLRHTVILLRAVIYGEDRRADVLSGVQLVARASSRAFRIAK
jgi:hypothetical protein